jgi:peptidoglycan/LPS O-acetylase OafA/YrhL
MPRFTAIDGLRAWLAWTVALSHIAQESGFRYSHGLLLKIFEAGNWGVQTFIIISGFVITHLLIEKQEPYRIYIIRRFMRLFPAFIFCCFLGAISYRVANEIGEYSWFQSENAELFQSQQHFLLANILAHLTMLHGIIPNDLLMLSEYNFLPPAWSVSLEWQFYIIAPFVILLCRSRIGSVILVLITAASMIAYGRWLSPHWRQPSIIVGQASFFLIGIGSRFAAPRLLGVVVAPTATALAGRVPQRGVARW